MILIASQLKVGYIIKFDGQLCRVTSLIHHTPGNLRAMVQTKMKNIQTGANVEYRWRSDEKAEKISMDQVEMEYLYSDDQFHYFMNTEDYEQTNISEADLGELKYLLLPNTKFMVELYEGRPMGIVPPQQMVFQIVDTDPNMKGATVTSSMKPAKLETGLTVMVPQFVNTGEYIRINTDDNSYLERVQQGK